MYIRKQLPLKVEKCEICSSKVVGMIRGCYVCKYCYYLFKMDNLKRDNPTDIKILRECRKCHKNYLSKINYSKKEHLLPTYLCKKCE